MKLKICFIVTDVISFNVLCRDQLEYFNNSEELDITLICGGDVEGFEVLKLRNIGDIKKVSLLRKPSLFNDIRGLTQLTFFLVFNRFDLVVYSTPKALLLGSIASSIALQERKVAVVQGRVYENYKGLKKKIFQNLDKLSFRISDDVLFVSKSLLDVCNQENIINARKAKILGKGSFNGVNTDIFKPISRDKINIIREKFGIPTNTYIVCVVGRICEDKGIKDIEVIAKTLHNKNIKFVFAGNFEDEIAKSIVDKIIKNDQGYYIPQTSQIHEIFQCSDLHLFLSHREGFGNVAIEAASCGVPTFAYDVVGIQDSVNNNITGQKFIFKDTSAVARAVDSASVDTYFSEKYSRARDWAIENFNREKVWQGYLNFYLKRT